MTKYGIINYPGQIYNDDESGVPLYPKASNAVVRKVVLKRFGIVQQLEKDKSLLVEV